MDEQAGASFPFAPARVKVIAGATVIEEMLPLMPDEMPRQVLDFGLHLRPGGFTAALQEAINASPGLDAVLLGYGLCSRGVVGLRATHCRLVVPQVDDCMAIFLGSRSDYESEARREPGTHCLTKGWIEVGDSPSERADRLAPKYGRRRADWMVRQMLRNHTRLAFIDSRVRDIERYRERAVATAERFGLRFEEIKGSPSLVRKLLFGPWDRECVVVPQGGVIRFEDFVSGVGVPGAPSGPGSELKSDRIAPIALAMAADWSATDGA